MELVSSLLHCVDCFVVKIKSCGFLSHVNLKDLMHVSVLTGFLLSLTIMYL